MVFYYILVIFILFLLEKLYFAMILYIPFLLYFGLKSEKQVYLLLIFYFYKILK